MKAEVPKSFSWFLPLYVSGFFAALISAVISLVRIMVLPKTPARGRPLKRLRELDPEAALVFTDSSEAPLTCGIFRGRILLPTAALNWTDRRLRSALSHELAHHHRRDPLIRFVATLIRAFLWFHPLVWLAHRQLVLAQEEACDERAVRGGIAPADYAEDLLSFVESSRWLPDGTVAMARRSQIGKRVERVLSFRSTGHKRGSLFRVIAPAICLVLILVMTGFADESAGDKKVGGEAGRSVNQPRGEIKTRDGAVIATSKETGVGGQPNRAYPMGEIASHVMGFIRTMPAERGGGLQGVSGIERSMNEQLAQGQSVLLSIDSRIQRKAYEILEKSGKPGSVVVSEPATGAILAMASWPGFNPEDFAPEMTLEQFRKLQSDERKPLFSRATNALYPPGSTAKLLVSLAAGYAGLGNPKLHCEGHIQYGKVRVRDWKTFRNEDLTIPGALETSCNTYFMQLGNQAGVDALREVGRLLHLGEPSLSEVRAGKSVFLPDSEPVTEVNLAITSIGQGTFTMTPLDVNVMTSAIATGVWRQPYLVVDDQQERASQTLVGQGGITRETLEVIRKGMVAVVQGERGTGKRAAVEGHTVAGKTGTAQIRKELRHGWFTGYAPAESPKYCITFSIENIASSPLDVAPLAGALFRHLLERP